MGELVMNKLDPAFVAAAMKSLAEGVVLVDVTGRITFVNQAFAAGLGIPAEQIVGRQWDDPILRVTDLDGRPISPENRAYRRILSTRQPVLGYEYIVYHVSGRPVRVLLNGVPVLGTDGTLEGVAFTLIDITDRHAAEDALREREAMLRAFVDQSRYGLFISSVEGDVLLYNNAMETITGYSWEEVREKGWLEVAFPDPAERARAATQAQQQLTGEVPYVEEMYTRKDGTKIWVSSQVSPVRLHGQDYISGILIDITDRMQAEEQVRYQSSLLEHARNAVMATDTNGCITFVNTPAEKLFGWKPGEALGKDVIEWTAPRAAGPDQSSLLEKVAREGRWEGEATMRRADGEEVPILLALGSVRLDGGELVGFVGVASDLTEIKAAQRALEEKDRAIRQAYVDVVSAVTGGKLVLMTQQELEASLGEPVTEPIGISYETLSETRHRVMASMRDAGTTVDPSEAVIAYGEAATNALKHAGGGRCAIYRKPQCLQVVVSDDGGGIDFRLLPHATLVAGFSTQQTLGMGFTIMLELTDRLLLATGPGCTRVVLEFGLG